MADGSLPCMEATCSRTLLVLVPCCIHRHYLLSMQPC
jgi:hypothetical protein